MNSWMIRRGVRLIAHQHQVTWRPEVGVRRPGSGTRGTRPGSPSTSLRGSCGCTSKGECRPSRSRPIGSTPAAPAPAAAASRRRYTHSESRLLDELGDLAGQQCSRITRNQKTGIRHVVCPVLKWLEVHILGELGRRPCPACGGLAWLLACHLDQSGRQTAWMAWSGEVALGYSLPGRASTSSSLSSPLQILILCAWAKVGCARSLQALRSAA